MKHFRLIQRLAAVGLLLLYGCLGETPPGHAPLMMLVPPVAQPRLDEPLQRFLDDYKAYFADAMAQTRTPGAAVVVVKDGRIVLLEPFGHRSVDSGEPVDAHTVFRIGSLSKGFAGVLTGRLVEEGALSWQEPVQPHCPYFTLHDPAQAERLQVRHVLSHTSGLPYHAYSNLIQEGWDLPTIVADKFPGVRLHGPEGTFYAYQNVAYCLIEPVLQDVTGESYAQLLHSRIFAPAGMADASCDRASLLANPNRALPHHPTAQGWVADSISSLYYDFAAAGGVNASISDMGEWLRLLLGHKPEVISRAALDQVFTPVVKTGQERRVFAGWIERDSAAYAMGWRVLQKEQDTLIYHAGFVNNYHCEIAFNRQEDIGIAVLFNANSPLKGHCIRTFFDRWKEQ